MQNNIKSIFFRCFDVNDEEVISCEIFSTETCDSVLVGAILFELESRRSDIISIEFTKYRISSIENGRFIWLHNTFSMRVEYIRDIFC